MERSYRCTRVYCSLSLSLVEGKTIHTLLAEKNCPFPLELRRPDGFAYIETDWTSIVLCRADRQGYVVKISGREEVPYAFLGDDNTISVQRLYDLATLPHVTTLVCVCVSHFLGITMNPFPIELEPLALSRPWPYDEGSHVWPDGGRSSVPVDREFTIPSAFRCGITDESPVADIINEGWTGSRHISGYTHMLDFLDRRRRFRQLEVEEWRAWLCATINTINTTLGDLHTTPPVCHKPQGISIIDVNTPVDVATIIQRLPRGGGIGVQAENGTLRPIKVSIDGLKKQRQVGRKGSVHCPPLPGSAILTAQLFRLIVDAYSY